MESTNEDLVLLESVFVLVEPASREKLKMIRFVKRFGLTALLQSFEFMSFSAGTQNQLSHYWHIYNYLQNQQKTVVEQIE